MAIYVNQVYTIRFKDMTAAESAPLLDYRFAHGRGRNSSAAILAAGHDKHVGQSLHAAYAVNDYDGFRANCTAPLAPAKSQPAPPAHKKGRSPRPMSPYRVASADAARQEAVQAPDPPKSARGDRDPQEAGRAIHEIYAKRIDVTHKDDKSPVTTRPSAEAIILRGLKSWPVRFPVIAEERWRQGASRDQARRVLAGRSADGTKEFIKKNGEFTVNIALIVDRRPLLELVGAPAFDGWAWPAGSGRNLCRGNLQSVTSASRSAWRRTRA